MNNAYQPMGNTVVPNHIMLTDLPQIPEHFIKEARELAYASSSRSLPIKSSVFASRTVMKDNYVGPPIYTKRYELSLEFRAWIEENIAENTREVSICRSPTNPSQWQGPHTDWSRDYLLLYVLATGGPECRTCWYDVPDPTVIKQDPGWTRRRRPHTWVENYDDIILKDSIQMPLNSWTLINVMNMHGVENISEDRLAVHIGLDGTSVLKSSIL